MEEAAGQVPEPGGETFQEAEALDGAGVVDEGGVVDWTEVEAGGEDKQPWRRRVAICQFRGRGWGEGRVRWVSWQQARRQARQGRACVIERRRNDPGDRCNRRDCRRWRDWDDWDRWERDCREGRNCPWND
jgi:hypothetical protein